MKTIQMEFNYLSQDRQSGIAKIAGQVDLNSVAEFREFIQKVAASPCKVIIFDLGQMQYMNSTGFGVLASFAMEEKEKEEREILFCNMQSQIHNTFTIFGLEQMWKNFASVDEAIAALHNQKTLVKEPEITFPMIRSCTHCKRPSNFAKPGHYKCPYCSTIHQLDDRGSLTQIAPPKKKKSQPTQELVTDDIDINLPSDVIHLSRIRDFIFSFFSDMFTEQERADMAMAVDEACGNAIEHAHKFDRTKKINLHLSVNVRKIMLTVKDSGENTFQNVVQSDNVNQDDLKKTGRGMGLFLIKQIMDEVHIKPTETWGTAITMVKKVKSN